MISFKKAVLHGCSAIWRTLRLGETPLSKIMDRILAVPLPIGLPYPYGTLYGWTIHETLHNPEQETIDFFKKNIKHGERIADIGANIGYYTLLFSSLVGENGKVVSFEPSPKAFASLKKAARGLHNVTLVNKGVYSRNDTLKLYFKRGGDPMGSVVYKRGIHQTDIQVIALRDYPETFEWLKIDVEGAELEVLRGLRTPTRAVLEVAQGIQQTHGHGVPEFLTDIESLGYTIYFIQDGGTLIKYDGKNIDLLKSNIYIEPTKSTHG